MHRNRLIRFAHETRPLDALFAASLFLGLERSHHAWTLGLLTAWIGLRCCIQIFHDRNQRNWRQQNLSQIVISSLVFFQARTIIRLDDHPGASFYILIAAALSVGATYLIDDWTRLLRWISCSALFINTKLIWIASSGYPAGSSDNWLTAINNQIFEQGFGRVNALASVIALTTILCFYGLRRDHQPIAKVIHTLGCISGYALCLQTGSRMAAGVPLIAAMAAFAICIKDYIPNRSARRIQTWITSATAGLIAAAIWATAIQPDIGAGMASEKLRLSFWQCWLQNSIFAGNGKIVHGIGYNLENMVNACNNQSADSGLIQLIGQHGLLGVLAIGLLLTLLIRSLLSQRAEDMKSITHPCRLHCSWSEAGIGSLLTVILCNLTTPAYLGSFVGAALTGLALSMSLIRTDSETTVK